MMRKLTSWFRAGATRGEAAFSPELPLDVRSVAFVADPAPTYAWLREYAPIAPLKSGGYILSRAADIEAAFTDSRLGNAPSRFSMLAEKNRARYVAADVAVNIPPFLDKPRHVDIRRPLSAAFFRSYEGVESWLGSLAAAQAEAAMMAQGSVCLVADVGRVFAQGAMARFVGLPANSDQISSATSALFTLFAPITDREDFAKVNAGLEAARHWVLDAVRARRADFDPSAHDLISQLLAREEGLGDVEIADNALLVLADGIENIEAVIAMAFVLRAGSSEFAPLCANGLVDAVLRLETPAQLIARVVRVAHEREGVFLAEGTPVFLALGSAGRDPNRSQTRDMAFGLGRHQCIGAPLGRALAREMVGALMVYGVVLETGPEDIGFVDQPGHRWPRRVMARVGAAA